MGWHKVKGEVRGNASQVNLMLVALLDRSYVYNDISEGMYSKEVLNLDLHVLH